MTVLGLTVTSCASNKPVIPQDVPRASVSPSLTVSCQSPTLVPKRDLKRSEVVQNWNKDRSRLRVCKNRHKALVEQVNTINNGGQE